MSKTIRVRYLSGFLLMTLLPCAQADEQSRDVNPHGLEYGDITLDIPDYDEPFKRDGRLVAPGNVLQVVAGVSADDVRTLIGNPLGTGQGARGTEWDYNLKLGLADHDFIVCQYKVVFDSRSETVLETVWRRYQCRDALTAYAARSEG